MKKSTKKHLLLLVAIVALMSAAIFALPTASAAACNCANPVLVDGATINPTCTAQGYTEVKCSVCGEIVGKKDVKDPIGHSFDEWIFETSGDGSEYNKLRQCERCNTVHYELTGENKAVYHKVTYINPWDTDTQEDMGYTKLALTYKDEPLTFESEEEQDNIYRGELYVLRGGTAAYLGKTPYREKDRAFGRYNFVGWDNEAALANVTENLTAYAVFEGDPEVYYYVTFYNDNGAISKELSVRHGSPIDDTNILPYTAKEATISTVYTFNKWDADISAIYGNAGIKATYTEVPQMYLYKFYKYDGTPFKTADGTADLKETCAYGGESIVGLGITAAQLERPADFSYIYSWTGQWQLKNRPGYIIDLNRLTVPVGTDPEVEAVELTPVYTKRLKIYDLQVTIEFPSDVAENAPSFWGDSTVIQVTNAAGQLVGAGETEVIYKEVNGTRVPYIVFNCQVNYSSAFYVVATTYDDKYKGEGQSLFVATNGEPTKVTVQMVKNDTGEKCSCICHNTIFRGLWARILNLIYNIFGRKIVCCDDMYATLGGLLAYTK